MLFLPQKTYRVPRIIINGKKENPQPYEGSILDYMGIPTKIENAFTVNALPIRAYVKIWNEFFRDENVDNAAIIKTDDQSINYQDGREEESMVDEILKKAIGGGRCLPVNKFHDYFTSCLPYPQRGPEVSLPLTGNATVYYGNHLTGKPYTVTNLIENLEWTPQINDTASISSSIWRASVS